MSSPGTPSMPSVSSFDPVEWTKKIDALQKANAQLRTENVDLKAEATKKANEAAIARGDRKALTDQIAQLQEKIAKSDNIKELERLRAEVASLHQAATAAAKDNFAKTEMLKAKLADAEKRTSKAEGRFQNLEGTASMLSSARDAANASAAAMMAERDKALQAQKEAQFDAEGYRKELIALRAEKAATAKSQPQTKPVDKKA